SGAMQPDSGQQTQAFAAKFDPNGKVKYATYIGGAAATQGKAIAVDDLGNAYITGSLSGSGAGFRVTPGSLSGYHGGLAVYAQTGFIVKLDPKGGSAIFSIVGFGGNQILLDRDGSIYAAGALTGPVPTTLGAFQASADNKYCGEGFFFGPLPCYHQHIA